MKNFFLLDGCDFHFCLHVLSVHKEGKKKKRGRFLFSLRFGPSAANPLYTLPSFPAIRPRPSQSRRPAKEPDSRGTRAASPPPQKKPWNAFLLRCTFHHPAGNGCNPPFSTPLPKESTPTHSDTSTPLMAFEKLPFKPSKVLQPTQTTDGSSRVQVLVHAANVTFSRHCIHLQRYNVLAKIMKWAALGSPNPSTPNSPTTCLKTLCCLSPKRRLIRNLGRSHGMFPVWLRAHRKHSHQGKGWTGGMVCQWNPSGPIRADMVVLASRWES